MTQLINIDESDLDKPIYRIVDYDFVFEMVQKNTNTLISPKLWNDPFENVLKHVRFKEKNHPRSNLHHDHLTYSQCWSFSSENDLLWKVYSPSSNSVRLKSTPRKLLGLTQESETIVSIIDNPSVIETDQSIDLIVYETINIFIGKVQYLTQNNIYRYIKKIKRPTFKEFISTLFIKREPFANENEFRIVVWHQDTFRDEILDIKEDLFKYKCPFNQLVEEIVFDPRISDNKFEALKKSLIETGAKCQINKSDIYSLPEIII